MDFPVKSVKKEEQLPLYGRIRGLQRRCPRAVQQGRLSLSLDPVSDVVPIVHKTPQQQSKHIYDHEDGGGINLKGTIFAYGSSKKRDHSSDVISTDLSVVHQLDNPETWFDSAIQRQENRTWIENALKAHGKIYMIIGFQTVHNAQVNGQNTRNKESSFTLQAPGTAAVAAVTGIPVIGDALDPSIGRESHEHRQSKQSFTVPGEQIVAVQYRRIRFRFFSSGHIEQKHLESKTSWRYVWDKRGQASDAVDIIETGLAYEDMSDEDNELDDLLDSSDDEI